MRAASYMMAPRPAGSGAPAVPVYCSWGTVSVALRAGRFGYGLHGHDVRIQVCLRTRGVVDLSLLHRLVSGAASRYTHRPLWETLCPGDPLIEHLAARILVEVSSTVDGSEVVEAWAEAEVPEGRIIVSLGEARRLLEECR